MGYMKQLPLDEDMIERAGATLNDLVGHQLKRGVNNPYIDADDYVKRLCRGVRRADAQRRLPRGREDADVDR